MARDIFGGHTVLLTPRGSLTVAELGRQPTGTQVRCQCPLGHPDWRKQTSIGDAVATVLGHGVEVRCLVHRREHPDPWTWGSYRGPKTTLEAVDVHDWCVVNCVRDLKARTPASTLLEACRRKVGPEVTATMLGRQLAGLGHRRCKLDGYIMWKVQVAGRAA